MSTVDAYAAAKAAVTEVVRQVESDDQLCFLAHALQCSRDGEPGRMKVLTLSKLTSLNLQQTPTGFTFEAYLERERFAEAFPTLDDLLFPCISDAFDYVGRQVKLERILIVVDVADLIAIEGPFRLHLSKPDRMLYVVDGEVMGPRIDEVVSTQLRRLLSRWQLRATGSTTEDVAPGDASGSPPPSSPPMNARVKAARRKRR
jgi:hypothetical protein